MIAHIHRRARGVYLAVFSPLDGGDDAHDAFPTLRAAKEWCDEQAPDVAAPGLVWSTVRDGLWRGGAQ